MIGKAWYFRLFYVHLLVFVVSWLLAGIIKPKRMGPPTGKSCVIVFWIGIILGWVLMWFVPFTINLAFWIGLGIIVLGEVTYALGFIAMREHPEKKKLVVDWGIYKVSRHSHVLAGIICLLGVIVIGWNVTSIVYMVLWLYLALWIVLSHFYVLNEEKVNIERFGQEYVDYINKTPRYIGIPKSGEK